MSSFYTLYEHSAGYGLFRVKEHEEIGMLEKEVIKAAGDMSKFRSIVQLVAFTPFKNAANALSNCNSISEGIVHEDLVLFLESNIPKGGKGIILGVSDSKLGAAIQESLGLSIQITGVVPEIIRGIRLHFHKFVDGFTALSSQTAQLGLGHSYSRAKVKFNVNRIDNMVIHSISLVDQLDKDINTFSMRIREWYGYHFPELVKIVSDNGTYAQLAKFIKNRKSLSEEHLAELENIVFDSAKAQAILDASRKSMGMDISEIDLANVELFATKVSSLTNYRKRLGEYLRSKMSKIAPNLATLIGDTVGARLISHAGSLTNLAKYPASTVQILGAEKALFRALKTRGNTPKYGLIFHSSFIGRAGNQNKGRISRYLANKCSIASRIDCFSEIPSTIFGDKLKEQVEERLRFYQDGNVPRKNIDVMKLAVEENASALKSLKKKKKKSLGIENYEGVSPEKTKAHKRKISEVSFDEVIVDESLVEAKEENPAKRSKKDKKKKRKSLDASIIDKSVQESLGVTVEDDESLVEVKVGIPAKTLKKEKKKRKSLDASIINESVQESLGITVEDDESLVEVKEEIPAKTLKKDKKKRRALDASIKEENPDISVGDDGQNADESLTMETPSKSFGKPKGRAEEQLQLFQDEIVSGLQSSKKKKKKKKSLGVENDGVGASPEKTTGHNRKFSEVSVCESMEDNSPSEGNEENSTKKPKKEKKKKKKSLGDSVMDVSINENGNVSIIDESHNADESLSKSKKKKKRRGKE